MSKTPKKKITVQDADFQPVAAEIAIASSGTNNLGITAPKTAKLPLHFNIPAGLLGSEQTREPESRLRGAISRRFRAERSRRAMERRDERRRRDSSSPFPSPSLGEEAKAHIKITPKGGGEPIKFDTGNARLAETTLRLLDVTPELKDVHIEITPGLEGGSLALMTEPFAQDLHRQAPLLFIEYADWESRGKDGPTLRLDMNQSVDLPSAQAAVSFEPPVENVKVSSTWSRGLLISGDFASKMTYTL